MTLVWCISSLIGDLNKQASDAVKREIDRDAEYIRTHESGAEISICNSGPAGGIERRSIVGDIDTIREICNTTFSN